MNASAEPTAVRPYESAAAQYWEAGWHGVLPLPPGHKSPPPEGWTGWEGDTPSYADVQAWTEDRPRSNVGLRMPPDVLGVDVDQYKGKHGAYTLMQCESRWVPLPPTWRSTSRDDGASGIRFFKVPAGLEWPGILPGGDVELVHHGHRYACVSPSLHPEGRPYRWYDPDGVVSTVIPRPDELPPLPVEWIVGLGARPHVHQPRADMGSGEVIGWLANLPNPQAAACEWMAKRSITASQEVRDASGSRHDKARDQVLAIVRGGEQGHTGTNAAIDRVRSAFIVSVVGDNSRTPREASSEWQRILDGAVKIVVGNPEPTMVEGDPCPPVMGKLSIPPRTRRIMEQASSTSSEVRRDEVDEPGPANMRDEALRLLMAPPPSSTPGDEAATNLENSWRPVKLAPYIAGQFPEDPPAFLARTDGVCLFYAGRINGILGEAEAGKTWIALETVRQAVAKHLPVLYLDFEDTPSGIVKRLQLLGVPDADLDIYLTYICPDQRFTSVEAAILQQILDEQKPVLIFVDGVNAAMSLNGLDLMDNKDATEFSQLLLKPLARTGACVVTVDHLPKNNTESKGGIGAQAKRAMITGCAIRATVIKPFGVGQHGELLLTVDKDRSGQVRGKCRDSRTIGTALLDSDEMMYRVGLSISPADTEAIRRAAVDANFQRMLSEICDKLGKRDEPVSKNELETFTTGMAMKKREAIAWLVAEGYIAVEPTQTGRWHTLIKPFDQGSSTSSKVRRDEVDEAANEGHVRLDEASPPFRGDDVDEPRGEPGHSESVIKPRLLHERVTINDEGEFIDLDTGAVIDPDELDKDV